MNNVLTLRDFVNNIRYRYCNKTAYKFLRNDEIVEKSFINLCDDSECLGSYLLKNYGERNKIAILGATSYEWICTYFGIVGSNNIAVGLDRNLNYTELCNMLNFAEVKVLFLSKEYENLKDEFVNNCTELQDIFILEEDFDYLTTLYYELHCDIKENDVAQMLFTSGTTDKSKVVMLTHKNIIAAARGGLERFNSTNVALTVLPIHHCYELYYGNFYLLNSGIEICINDSMENLMKNMQIFKPTIISIVPLIVNKFALIIKQILSQLPPNYLEGKSEKERKQIFAKFHEALGGNLKYIFVGGATMDPEIVQLIMSTGITVIQGYGLTETAAACFANQISDNQIHTVGAPFIKGLEFKIVDDELLVKGPTVTIGYYKNEQANKESFTEDGFFKTGDLVRLAEDNKHIYFIGRKKNIIILANGENVYPEEMENYTNNIENVLNSVVFENNKQISVIIQVESINYDVINKIDEKIYEINLKLPTYKKITNVYYTDKAFPTTTTKKVKRDILIKSILEESNNSTFIAPTTPIQIKIYNNIKQLLCLEKDFSINDDLFDLGLDSLSSFELAVSFDIDVQDIYNNKTVEKLAQFIQCKNVINDKSDAQYINGLIKNIKSIEIENTNDNYFITGATGYLGSHILNILANQNKNIYCLVRDKEKLNCIYRYYFNEEVPENVKIVVGNIKYDRFGLDNINYKELIDNVDNVIHTAANVKHVGDFEQFYEINVSGTENIINFTKDANATLHYASTYSVSGIGVVEETNKHITFNENILNVGQKYQQNVYVHTKYLAEEKIIQEINNGLKCNIYRIGSLTWRDDGVFQINENENGLYNRLLGLNKIKMYTDNVESFKFDFTKVDECANAFVLLAQNNKINNIYHLFNPYALDINDLNKIYTGYKKVDSNTFNNKINKITDKNIAIYSLYEKMLAKSYFLNIDCSETCKVLYDLGFEWSKIDETYLRKKIN